MQIFEKADLLQAAIAQARESGRTVGFVPTMGALHAGHISLVKAAHEQCDIVVCSIFVNPTQFNDPQDFERYPDTFSEDLDKLWAVRCHFVFHPSVNEMYPEPDLTEYRFGVLETYMEGANRPGHFNGVGMIVRRLLEIVQPDKSFFGEKDYQQLLIVKELVRQYNLNTEIVGCPIIREPHGLAMSSRNELLTPEQRGQASVIHSTLQELKSKVSEMPVKSLREWGLNALKEAPGLDPEYLEIADAATLAPLDELQEGQKIRAFVACFCGEIRLIDNMALN